ncbi:MAG: hypothetical protein E7199_06565 [Schwartzia succinivorans]|nr:hypothetical protein [Schwartzia succinivorans]
MEATRKSALVMADGYEIRGSIDELRTHFDAATAVELFKTGQLLTWLEERYYDAAAEKVSALKQEYDRIMAEAAKEDSTLQAMYEKMIPKDEDIAKFLCATLGVSQAVVQGRVSAREVEKRELLRKQTDDATILSYAALTAFNQEDMAELLDAGEKTIYLCGSEFEIPMRVEGIKYVGILGTPTVHIAAAVPSDIKKKGISLSNVAIDYLEDEMEKFIKAIQSEKGRELADNVEPDLLVLRDMSGAKSEIKNSIRQAATEAENCLIEHMARKIDYRMERLENMQEQYERMCEERGIPAEMPKPTLEEVRKALEEGHERIIKEMTGKLADKLVSRAKYEMLHFDLFRGSDYMLDNANDLDDVSDQLQRKYITMYNKRDMEGVVQAYLRAIHRGVERLQDAEAKKNADDV